MAPKRRFFIGGLSPGIKEADIKQRLARFGNVCGVEIRNKRDGDGLVSKTFAYVDMHIIDENVGKCLQIYNSDSCKGNGFFVQIAKESFLQRLRQEQSNKPTKTSLTLGTPEKWSTERIASAHSDGARLQKALESSRLQQELDATSVKGVPANRRKTSIPSCRLDTDEDSAGSADTDEIIQQQKAKFRSEALPGKQHHSEVHSFLEKKSSSEIGMKLLYSKNRQLHVNGDILPSEATPVVKQKWSKKAVASEARHQALPREKTNSSSLRLKKALETNGRHDSDRIQKHILANQKRLASLQQRQLEKGVHQKAIQTALSSLDNNSSQPINKKIVFDSSDEDSEGDVIQEDQVHVVAAQARSLAAARHELFDDSDSTEPDSAEEIFRIRPQFEGKQGQKLATLQARFANDERFRLDEKFASDDESDAIASNTDAVDEPHSQLTGENVSEEKEKYFEILKDVLGQDVRSSQQHTSRKKIFKDASSLRFDPTREDASHFELQKEQKSDKGKSSQEKLGSRNVKRTTADNEPLPEVSKERFYEVRTDLKEALNKPQDEGFSLLKLFGKDDTISTGNTSDTPEAQAILKKPLQKKNLWESNPFRYDSSDDERVEEGNSYPFESNVASRDLFKGPEYRFFFRDNDPRLKEGVEFFKRNKSLDQIMREWQEKRAQMMEKFHMKRKKALQRRKGNTGRRSRGRPRH